MIKRESLYSKVFAAELAEIAARRRIVQKGHERPHDPVVLLSNGNGIPEDVLPSTTLGLVGLCLSGGGIRSAALGLGVVGQLAQRGLLEEVDYLSTVSGGGYIGSTMSTVLSSPAGLGAGELDAAGSGEPPIRAGGKTFPFRHEHGVQESDAFQHLRNHANYLLTGGWIDRIGAVVTVLRGLVINGVMLIPYVCLGAMLLALTYLASTSGIGAGLSETEAADPANLDLFRCTPAAFVLALVVLVAAGLVRRVRSADRAIEWVTRTLLVLCILAPLWESQLFALKYVQGSMGDQSLLAAGYDWLVGIVIAPFLFAGRASKNLGTLRNRLFLYALGLLGPVVLWAVTIAMTRWLLFGIELGYPLNRFSIEGSASLVWMRGAWIGGFAGVTVLLSLTVDVNLNSLHTFYRDRLSRAFLFFVDKAGGVHQKLDEDAHTKVPNQLRLSDLNPKGSAAPYHLINTTINIQVTNDAVIGRRQADFFLLSKHYVGSVSTGYENTKAIEARDRTLNLGTAMAISGAVAGPTMGGRTIRPLTFILAMLNLRLGYWLPNPSRMSGWTHNLGLRGMRSVGPVYFVLELLGRLGRRLPRVNLSDGGHIENLGAYELLRRRCAFIIIVDGEADPGLAFRSLTQLIRYALLDLAVDIDIDLSDIRRNERGFSTSNCALGTIHYGKSGDGQEVGRLLYIKASVQGDESESIRGYLATHPDFPHESTVDQFFTEAQFEAYRHLGWHIVRELCEKGWDDTKSHPDVPPIEQFFNRVDLPLRSRFANEKAFVRLQSQLSAIERQFHDRDVAPYTYEIYPELWRGDTEEPRLEDDERRRRVFHICQQQFQLMENVFIELRLDLHRNRRHQINRGWTNLFTRWAKSSIFQHSWAVSMGTFGIEFQQYCDNVLKLSSVFSWSLFSQSGERSDWVASIQVQSADADAESSSTWVGAATMRDSGMGPFGRRTLVLESLDLAPLYDTLGLLDRILARLRDAVLEKYAGETVWLEAARNADDHDRDPMRHPLTLRRCGFLPPSSENW